MQNAYYYTFFLIFVIVAYMMTVDRNVADYLLLNIKMLKVNIERLKWLIVYHPNNPITNFLSYRRYKKIAEELQKEMAAKASSETVPQD